MTINKNDIGSIFSLNESGNLIIIDDITDEFVYYRNEMGETFTTNNYEIEGFPVTDSQRIELFRENTTLGSALAAAEFSSLRKILVGAKHDPEVLKAVSVLEDIHQQQEALRAKIQFYGKDKSTKPLDFLDNKIQNASNAIDDRPEQRIASTPHER